MFYLIIKYKNIEGFFVSAQNFGLAQIAVRLSGIPAQSLSPRRWGRESTVSYFT